MTRHRDLKRRARDRQARTGESYVTALRQVRAARPPDTVPVLPPDPPAPAMDVIEMIELTEIAAALGLHGQISMEPGLLGQIYVGEALAQFRRALHQPELALMRAVLLNGEDRSAPIDFAELRRFRRRLDRRLPGVSDGGAIAALHVDGPHGRVLVACWLRLAPPAGRAFMPPRLIVTSGAGWRMPWQP
jgi:hypothetical protein